MTLAEELTWRGFVNQMTFADITDVNEPRTLYWGVDPSADSMTIGNLAAAMMVRHFIDHGYKAILLVGGATGMIGDPDGKKQERDLLTVEQIAANKKAIAGQYATVFDGQAFSLVDNYDWFKDMNYLDFLRDVGKHMSMTQMLDREFVQSRIGEGGAGISYAEFSYSLIQGYDFLHLYREKGATLQVCGADQWGNSITGASLIRKLDGGEAHVYSTPLVVNKATGKKFGKSEEGAIWLDPNKTSPFKFYQFWLNADDEGVIDYLKIYTLLDKEEIGRLEGSVKERPAEREAQQVLAHEITKLVHGEARAEQARNVTAVLFGDTPFKQLLAEELDMLAREIPTTTSSRLVNALVTSGVVASNGEARRLIAARAVSVNGAKVTDDHDLTVPSLIKKGKNNFILVR
ncbi:TPA: tyrosine--tRNA ligase [Candidatus Saccharibacteria bacterium]|nr:tyrosine--tRNA ligase [Candidatus Saccharibacteria bacterium]HRK41189.1 tyrosine--tRNA ligase [Candidatus Saccharibacteria bacterium]